MAIRDRLEVYVDGAAKETGAWAIVAYINNKHVFETAGFTNSNSIMRTETLAFIDAVNHVAMMFPSFINTTIFYSDSLSLVRAYNDFSGIGKNNNDLAHLLDEIREDYPGLVLKWVKGHSKSVGNKKADRLAKKARLDQKRHFKISAAFSEGTK